MPARPVAALVASLVATKLAAQQVDVVRGRVTGPEREPVEGARVTVTSISGGVNRSARTDKNGRFTVTVPGGDGDYFVAFTALGYAPRRFEVKRVADEDFLLADATLQRAAQQLERQVVRGDRPRIGRGDAAVPDVGGTERAVDPSAVAPDQLGDFAAAAAAQPGVTPVPGADGDPAGFSVLGLSADQNQTTLNGLNFGASGLPRDAGILSSLVTSPYDVSVGGFSGARFNVRTRSGTNYVNRSASLFGTAPQLQWSDAAARALGQQTTNVSLGGSASGPLVYDKAFYALSYQLGRQASPLRSLLDADPAALAVTGVAPDSVRRLAGVLGAQGVPLRVAGLGGSRLSDNGSALAAVDLTPPSSNSGQAVNLTLNAGWSRQTPAALSLSEFPAHAGDRTNWNAGAQARHSATVRNVVLSETTAGGGFIRNAGSPYALLPSGQVLVGSTFDAAGGAAGALGAGTGGVRWLNFGGSPWMATRQHATNLSAMNQLSWFSVNNKHRLKLTTELRRDGFAQDQTTNRLGTFTYQSLDDLAAGRPATYTRRLAPRVRGGSATTAALSLGDSYRRTPRLQLQYGLRLDAHRFAQGPAENPLVAETFGVPNDAAPARLYASPRLGFSWGYGTAPQVSGFEGAVRGPRATVRGGVGVFQNTPQATLLGTAIDNTGLAAAVQQLTCVGPAAPSPAWGAYADDPSAIPARCADGTTGTAFANAAPDVTLFARDWRAQRSVRSNLSWAGPVFGNRFAASVEGTLSLNRQLPSFVDLNAAAARQFALGAEGGRPVYVRPSSIVPATGAVAAADGRVSAAFSRVAEQRSDLRSTSRQLQVFLRPTAFNPSFGWSVGYTFQDARDQARGFQSAAGDPRAVDWARGAFNTRHGVNYSLRYNVFNTVTLDWSGVARSGLPYTPGVAGDVNGDGYANDRAFVFDPRATAAADPALAAELDALLAGGGRGAACLRRQLGRVAGRNSCEGPWTQTANLSIAFNPLKVRLPQRASLSFTLSNPLGAADRLLHGGSNLRGWGQQPSPDPTLLYVRGFDAAAGRFRYAVNPRFGATRPQVQAFRQPATLTAMLRVDLGPTRERQQLTQQLDRGRRHEGSRMPEFVLKSQWGTGGVVNPMAQILRQADTLKLTGPQADSIATMNRRYVVRLDSIWTPVTKAWAALPDRYSHDAVYDQYREARRASVDLLLGYAPAVRALLTAEQRRKLPPFVASALDPRYLAAVRSGTAGVASGGLFGGGGFGGMGGFVPMGGGGAGGGNIIVR